MTNKLSDWGYNFQIKIIALLFTDRHFLQQISDILEPRFFESEANQFIVKSVKDYFVEFKDSPTMEVMKVKIKDKSIKLPNCWQIPWRLIRKRLEFL